MLLTRDRTVTIVSVLLLLVIAGIPRLAHLGLFLTADEKTWIARSYEFVVAFKELRFNDMLQTTHPGVTALWLIGGATLLQVWHSGIPFSSATLVHFIKVSQFPIALLTTLTIPLLYWLLVRVLRSRWIAFLGALLIALDPFLIGYSRVAHVDALLTHFLFIAALCSMLYVREGYRRRWLVASAIASALAVLTKVPAVFSIPFLGLLILTAQPLRQLKTMLRQRIQDVGIWLLLIVVLFVTLWPAILWVPDPKGNVLVLKRDISWAATTPHDAVEDYSLNVWHYPAAFVARTTPLTLGALACVLIMYSLAIFNARLRAAFRHIVPSWQRQSVLWLLAFVFFFVVMMTLGAKKGDRYILPIWPALDVLAALGIGSIVAFVQMRRPVLREQYLQIAVLGLLAVVAVFTVWQYHPYEISYSNPLFPANLSQELGWGEGLEQVGTWLNAHAPDARVASWYPQELQAFTTARVAHINAHEQIQVQYVVLYKNMFGRPPAHYANDFIDEYYKKRQPVFVAQVVGQEFAWVYEQPSYEQVAGELLPGVRVRQTVESSHPQLTGIDVLLANYQGKATAGEVHVRLLEEKRLLHEWTLPVRNLEDNRWQRFRLPAPLEGAPHTVTIEVEARGTYEGNAPTIRYSRKRAYHASTAELQRGAAALPVAIGDLAVRLRYLIGENGQEATEWEVKLLR